MGLRDTQAGASEVGFSNTRQNCDPGFYAGQGRENIYSKSKKKSVLGSRDIQASASEDELSNTRAHCEPGFYAG